MSETTKRARWWFDRRNPFLTINQRKLRDAYAWAIFLGFLVIEIIGLIWLGRKLL